MLKTRRHVFNSKKEDGYSQNRGTARSAVVVTANYGHYVHPKSILSRVTITSLKKAQK